MIEKELVELSVEKSVISPGEKKDLSRTLLDESQIALIESSWNYILKTNQNSSIQFYNLFFEQHAHFRLLFKGDMEKQYARFTAMISFAIQHLRKFDEIAPNIEALGIRHGAYGVEDGFYDQLEDVLMISLKEILGPKWSDSVGKAWLSFYRALVGIMTAPTNKGPIL
jgi:hemoglobin-like flavoprotein